MPTHGPICLLKNKYSGKRIFVVGNGPSINQINLDDLTNYCTVGMNKINLIYSDTEWRPDFYFYANSINHSFFPHVEENLNNSNFAIVDDSCRQYFNQIESQVDTDIFYFKRINLFSDKHFRSLDLESIRNLTTRECENYWSYELSNGVFHYHTFYSLFQILLYMGFNEIILLGFDLGRSYRNPHMVCKSGLDPHRFSGSKLKYLKASFNHNFIPSIINGVFHQSYTKILTHEQLVRFFTSPNQTNFDTRYLNNRIVYDGPRHDRQHLKGHILASRILQNNGVEVVNTSISSSIESYKKVSIDDILQ